MLLVGCNGNDSSSSAGTTDTTDSKTTSTAPQETTASTTDAKPVTNARNPLTGEAGYSAAAVGKRPVAVMVNNLKAALPQYGVAQADLLYEMPVEGGITRLMAVYADYTAMPDICSIRSCRYYYALLAHGMDAIYCHWGCDQTIALDTLNRLKLDRMDGGGVANGVIFFRDAARKKTYATEHTGYLKGSAVSDAISTYKFRTDWKYDGAFAFLTEEEKAAPTGKACTQVNLPYSDSYFSTFTYDTASQTYLKQHSGKPHMDSKTNTQLAFKNVLVLQTEIKTRPGGYLMDVGLTGGTGYYISQGAAQEMTWKRAAEDAKIEVFDTAGKPLKLNAGKSYIGLIGTGKTISIQ